MRTLAALLIVVLLAGCAPKKGGAVPPPIKAPNPNVHASDVGNGIERSATVAAKALGRADEIAATQPVPYELRQKINTAMVAIAGILDFGPDLLQIVVNEDAKDKVVEQLQTDKRKLEGDKQKLEWQNNSSLYRRLDGGVYAGILLCVGGAILLGVGKKLSMGWMDIGGPISGGGLLLSTLCYGFKAVGPYRWILGGAFVAEVVIASLWILWKMRDTWLAKCGIQKLMVGVSDDTLKSVVPTMPEAVQDVVKKEYKKAADADPTLTPASELLPDTSEG